MLKSRTFWNFQKPEFDQNLRIITRFLYTVQVGSKNYRRVFQDIYFSYLTCKQIWLNLPVDHHHVGYNRRLPKKKKTLGHRHSVLVSIIACNQTWQAATDWVDRRREDCMGYKLQQQGSQFFFSWMLGMLRGELKPHRSCRTDSNIATLFHVNCEFAWTTLHTYTQKTSFRSVELLPLWLDGCITHQVHTSTRERRPAFAKSIWDKSEVLWRTCWGTDWKPDGNPLGT